MAEKVITENRLAALARRAVEAPEERDQAIAYVIEHQGWSHGQIAELTGLTRGRIGQIAKERGAVYDPYRRSVDEAEANAKS